jgi:hypothetical protein
MMKSYTGWMITVCFFTVLIGGFLVLKNSSSGTSLDVSLATASTSSPQATTDVSKVPPLQNIPTGYKEYRNKQFGFSVYYPQEIPAREFVDRGPELTVAFSEGDGEPGFQIYVAPIDGTTITNERFLRDASSGIRKEQHDIQIAGVSGTTFVGFDARMGQTREIWFIHNHFLFEVLTYKELDGWLSDIMNTWRFI